MNFSPDVLVARLIHVESVVCRTLLLKNRLFPLHMVICPDDLIHHLIDHVPVSHPDLVEMDQRLVNVLVHSLLKLLQKKL